MGCAGSTESNDEGTVPLLVSGAFAFQKALLLLRKGTA